MKILTTALFFMMFSACTTVPQLALQSEVLFNDALFEAPTEHVTAGEIFALSEEMKRYVTSEIAGQLREKGPQQGLFDAIYTRGQLKIQYDSSMTRNASEVFAARSGNCLSMAIMTAAFAKEVGLKVQYQNVFVREAWSRTGNVLFGAGHVNVVLIEKQRPGSFRRDIRRQYTIDFLPPGDMVQYHTEDIDESTIIAMFMNNRAAEALAQGQLDNAYWLARAAIGQDPTFMSSYNTLGATYRSHGNLQEARKAFNFVLAREPEDTSVMFNLSEVLKALGRFDEAKSWALKVEKLRAYQPYHFFNLGRQAMKEGNFKAAKEFFSMEVKREPLNPEFNYWLASALFSLGEVRPAGRFMSEAVENSATHKDHALYATKLDRIRAAEQKEKLELVQ